MHYKEYLCKLIRKYNVDTISTLNADDLETVVRRAAKKLPPNAFGTPRDVYRKRLAQVDYNKNPVVFFLQNECVINNVFVLNDYNNLLIMFYVLLPLCAGYTTSNI